MSGESSRRAVLQGAGVLAGGLAAAANAQYVPSVPQALVPRGLLDGGSGLLATQQTPFDNGAYLARRAFLQHAEEMADGERARIIREQERIMRLRSMSDAAKQYHMRRLANEQQSVWQRYKALVQGMLE